MENFFRIFILLILVIVILVEAHSLHLLNQNKLHLRETSGVFSVNRIIEKPFSKNTKQRKCPCSNEDLCKQVIAKVKHEVGIQISSAVQCNNHLNVYIKSVLIIL